MHLVPVDIFLTEETIVAVDLAPECLEIAPRIIFEIIDIVTG